MSNPRAAPHLYGHARPKNKPIEISQSSIHSLSTELTLAKERLSKSTSGGPIATAAGRPRGTKTKSLFSSSNKGVASRAARDLKDDDDTAIRLRESTSGHSGLTDAEFARSRRKLEEKVKLYNALRKGDPIPAQLKQRRTHGRNGDDDGEHGSLVDFDRKWAEEGRGSPPSSSPEDEAEIAPAEDEEMVEYTDEFGRTRTGPKSVAEKYRQNPPTPPLETAEEENIIYGPFIQTHAFSTAQYSSLPENISRPDEVFAPLGASDEASQKHYDASGEIRTKGVGFFAFSADNEMRKKQMEDLENLRKATEEERKKKEEQRKRKREEIERRKEEVRRKRREQVGGDGWKD
ncbi:hypothetical protein BDZ91DRAFT_322410 [Kalaharituber pfeilii]|nr:hypothetical protein BDZ91DRAFT_322410 [Kalaharituber pfeilii]